MLNWDKSLKLHKSGMEYLFEATPFVTPVMDHGKGSFVWDVDGNRYLDLNAGQFCVSFGHAYKPFIEAVRIQMEKLYHTNTATLTPEVFEAAEAMAGITGGDLMKTIFLSTGSEANECALRYAQFYTKRNGVLCVDSGYHGLTLGSQAVTMGGKWARPRIPQFFSVTTPDYIHSGSRLEEREFVEECIQELKRIFEERGPQLAAMIMEPVIGVGGMVRMPDAFLKAARELCSLYGTVLIFDECQCGFARSGDWFVYQQAGVYPDMVTTAKAMGMGLAVSAVTFSKKITDAIDGRLVHFSSHQNDPVSAAVVKFVINEIRKNNILESNRENGVYLLKKITEICDEAEYFINPRGIGLMCAFDIDDSKIGDCRGYSNRFIKQLQHNGVLIQAIRQGRTFRLMPSYLTSKEEMNFLKDMCIKSVDGIKS